MDMEHRVKLIITDNNKIVFEKIYEDHSKAKLGLVKQLYKLICNGEISNCGEYLARNYDDLVSQGLMKKEEINYPNQSELKDNSTYCYGNFHYERVLPDLINHLQIMSNEIENTLKKGKYQIQFILTK